MSAVMAHCWRNIGVYGGDHSCALIAEVLHCRNCQVFQAAARSAFAVAAEEEDEVAPPEVGDGSDLSVLVLRLGGSWFGLPTAFLAELAADTGVRRVAHRTRGALEGLVNVRGELQLCVSLLERFGLGQRAAQAGSASARLVLLRHREQGLLAFRSDQVLGLRHVAEGQLEAAPATLPQPLSGCVRGVLPIDRLRVLLLDGEAVYGCLAAGLYE